MINGLHLSLHSNCHHQITYCKLNLSTEYPQLYEHLVWDYNKANVEGIKTSTESANWELMFNNKNVHKHVSNFNQALMKIFPDFTSNKPVHLMIEGSPLMNDFVKSKIKWKTQLYKTYAKNVYKCHDYRRLQEATNLISQDYNMLKRIKRIIIKTIIIIA